MIHEIVLQGVTKYVILGVFGEMVSWKYAMKQDLTDVKENYTVVEILRTYDTYNEAIAYLQGLSDMNGWLNFEICDDLKYHEQQFGKLTER